MEHRRVEKAADISFCSYRKHTNKGFGFESQTMGTSREGHGAIQE
jgi:hypothetical protein